MNAIKFWIALLTLSAAAPTHAVVVDFDDAPDATYVVGNSFTADGVQFHVVPYNGVGTQIRLDGTSNDKYLSMANSVGISVDVPPNINLISFNFRDACSPCSTTGITVNGIASVPMVQLRDLVGTTLGGVSVNVVSTGQLISDLLILTGPITSFATGGTEYLFDNLRLSVPEPTTGILALCGIAGFLLRSKR